MLKLRRQKMQNPEQSLVFAVDSDSKKEGKEKKSLWLYNLKQKFDL